MLWLVFPQRLDVFVGRGFQCITINMNLTEGRIKLRPNWFFDRIMPLKVALMGKLSQRRINAEF